MLGFSSDGPPATLIAGQVGVVEVVVGVDSAGLSRGPQAASAYI